MTARQPALRSARCLIMHAVIFGTLGISELQRRNASLVHICCASALNARLAVDEIEERKAAVASARLARSVLVSSAVILGSLVRLPCNAGSLARVMPKSGAPMPLMTVTSVTSGPERDFGHFGMAAVFGSGPGYLVLTIGAAIGGESGAALAGC